MAFTLTTPSGGLRRWRLNSPSTGHPTISVSKGLHLSTSSSDFHGLGPLFFGLRQPASRAHRAKVDLITLRLLLKRCSTRRPSRYRGHSSVHGPQMEPNSTTSIPQPGPGFGVRCGTERNNNHPITTFILFFYFHSQPFSLLSKYMRMHRTFFSPLHL
jgi:hypothetical protein